ncbi:MAG: cell division protein ZapA [Pseudomonadota bacterium]
MSKSSRAISVKILDREFNVISPADQDEALKNCAQYLDSRMRQIRDSGRVVGVDRIAIMAALNITQELLALHEQQADYTQSMNNRIRELQRKIDAVLNESKPLELSTQ